MCMSRKNYQQDIHQSIFYTVERQVPFACPAMNQKAERQVPFACPSRPVHLNLSAGLSVNL